MRAPSHHLMDKLVRAHGDHRDNTHAIGRVVSCNFHPSIEIDIGGGRLITHRADHLDFVNDEMVWQIGDTQTRIEELQRRGLLKSWMKNKGTRRERKSILTS